MPQTISLKRSFGLFFTLAIFSFVLTDVGRTQDKALDIRLDRVGEAKSSLANNGQGSLTGVIIEIQSASGDPIVLDGSIAIQTKGMTIRPVLMAVGVDSRYRNLTGQTAISLMGGSVSIASETFRSRFVIPEFTQASVKFTFPRQGRLRVAFVYPGKIDLPATISILGQELKLESVQDVAVGQSGSSAAGGTERADMRKYSDDTHRVSFSYPADWKQATQAEAVEVLGGNMSKYLTVVLFDSKDRTQNVNVQVLPSAGEDLSEAAFREFAQSMDRQFPDTLPGFRKISSRVVPFRDMASLEYVLEAIRPDGVRLRQKQFRTGKPGREIAITFSARSTMFDQADEVCFKTIINTLTVF